MTHALALAALALSGWSSPQVLSNGPIALGPELSVVPSGAAISVWDHESGPDCAQSPASLTCAHIVEFSQRSSTLGWSPPIEIARPGIGARPQVALNDAGRAAVIWVHDIGRDRVVQATYRTGTNEPFPNPSDLSAAVLEVGDHHVGIDASGNVAVVWAERHDTDFDVAADIRSAATGTWGAPIVLSHAAVAAGPAFAVTPQGDAYALWVERAEVYVAHGDLRNGSWDVPVSLSASGAQSAGDPVLAANAAGDVVAAWWRLDRPGGQAIVQAAYKAAGQGWRTQDVGPGTSQDVAIGPSGAAGVTLSGANAPFSAALRPSGGPWSAPERVAARGTNSRIALTARGDAVVVFRQSPELAAAFRPASVGAWQPLERLSESDPTSIRIGLDGGGNAVAVWNAASGDSLPVYLSSFPIATWQPTLANVLRPSIRGQARAGRTLRCDRGEWSGTIPITYAYSWLRNGAAAARGSRYRIRAIDRGTLLACRVKATNGPKTAVAVSRPVHVH